jgi:hypothetical protein
MTPESGVPPNGRFMHVPSETTTTTSGDAGRTPQPPYFATWIADSVSAGETHQSSGVVEIY